MRSAWLAFCSTNKIVTPSDRIWVMISKIAVNDLGGQTERRFVHQQDPRLGHQRASNSEHLLFAAAKRPTQLLAPFSQHGKERVDVVELGAVVALATKGTHLQILDYRHGPENVPTFGMWLNPNSTRWCAGIVVMSSPPA